jgi:hypothetical protein
MVLTMEAEKRKHYPNETIILWSMFMEGDEEIEDFYPHIVKSSYEQTSKL